MTGVQTCALPILHGFLEFKETWNKLTNFKLNHDVANQMWSEAKLGHILLLGPCLRLGVVEP